MSNPPAAPPARPLAAAPQLPLVTPLARTRRLRAEGWSADAVGTRVWSTGPWWRRLLRVTGPGLLVAVGYMDPGNWATDIEAGSRYGMALLWMVLASSLVAMLLQTLCVRLGVVADKDLAAACRERYPPAVSRALWLLAEVAIVACDVAEVLGSALALHLLFGVSILTGVVVTAFDTVVVLALQGRGLRRIQAIILGLVVTIGVCFAIEIVRVGPDWHDVARGLVPSQALFGDGHAVLLAIGILGATVMPHNLYLHSAIVRGSEPIPEAHRAEVLKLSTIDTVFSLSTAFVINAAILVLAASAFHAHGRSDVTEIQDAYLLLDPLVGGAFASVLFGIALLASGQSSTFTGTIAGQVVLEGFLGLKMPYWQRRLITRALALVPAFLGVLWLGDGGVGPLLIGSQVVLSMQLPFAIWPLIRITSDRRTMGRYASGWRTRWIAWTLFGIIGGANLWLLRDLLA